ncbi:unnamed protein product, partial [Rotaria socialis]
MEQECYAFICALDKRHNYLSGIKFTWETDHKALTQLNKKAQINKRCERWRLKILEYDFKVKYIPGLTNSMPDYLSPTPTDFDNIPNHLHVVTAVEIETRAMKLRNAKLPNTNSTEQLKFDSLDTSLEENRIIPFTNEQLKEAQQQDDYANTILKNIKKRKNYLI